MDGAAFRVFCFATADSLGTRSILRFAISENASIDIISAGSTPHTAVVAGSTTYTLKCSYTTLIMMFTGEAHVLSR